MEYTWHRVNLCTGYSMHQNVLLSCSASKNDIREEWVEQRFLIEEGNSNHEISFVLFITEYVNKK